MPGYAIDAARSKVLVCARSSIHDTNTTWSEVSGNIEADREHLAGAKATIEVDMTAFDAGDFLKNRKLKKDLDVARHPVARFELSGLSEIEARGDDRFAAVALGKLHWRGRTVDLRASGEGRVADDGIDATATFELDVRDLGVKPPRFLMLKVEEVVAVEVTVVARPA